MQVVVTSERKPAICFKPAIFEIEVKIEGTVPVDHHVDERVAQTARSYNRFDRARRSINQS